MSQSKKPVSRKAKPEPVASKAAGLVLDPAEVMRAMMAARKGKGKEVSSPEDSGEESDSDGPDSDGEVSVSESEDGSPDEELGETSEAGSSRSSTPARRINGNDNDAEDIDEELPDFRSARTTASAPTSRVQQATRIQAAPPSKPVNPFDAHEKPSANATFASLGLSQPLINALANINIKKPTEIQAACVGPILTGRDCIGGAKTGSGKTMAFALPIVERIARDPFGVWAVVLTPTRELAFQLTEQFIVVGKPLGLTTATIVGGLDMMAQARELDQRPHIIVATPGRLCDLLRSDGISQGKLSRVRTLVLDEADRLLTPTFAPELAYLFSQIPPKRQTCLFTATVSDAIMDLANKPPAPGKEKPFVYRVESDTMTVAGLKQKYLFLPSQIRDPYLYYLLHHPLPEIDAALRAPPKREKKEPRSRGKGGNKRRAPSPENEDEEETAVIPSTIIFTQRCATAHLLHLLLKELDVPCVPLHSHLTQPQRLLSLAQFRNRQVPVLVTTDVGSRGLDIPEVAMVINWDCPRRADDYVHRVGRTARAGRGGVAVTIITERDVELVKGIEETIGVELQELELPEEEVLEKLNTVSVARRVATMEMHDSGFGERQATNKAKAIKRARRDAAK
ncbi:ATP-dependent RNA helicase DBP8 [Saitozyma sp. JCM 24511]|nr:ATP-dependent RNA helicase DBP8 [Saitozyma sp. JCM 24511]